MPTKLERELKREIQIGPKHYIIRIDPLRLKLTEKGRRNGPEISWRSIISGDASLNESLKASVDAAANP